MNELAAEITTPSLIANAPFVVAIIATYHRKRELADLLALLSETPGVRAVVVVDNAADPEVRELVRSALLRAEYVAMESNRGIGPGLNRGMEFAAQKWAQSLTHYWILDDDVRFAPDTLSKLLAALAENDAQFVAPTITDPFGAVFAWPVLKSRRARKLFLRRKRSNPTHFAKGFEAQKNLPELRASMSISYLMERVCRERVGPIREDFWLHGEDIDYTSRIARQFRAVFCPAAVVEHYWGTPIDRQCPERTAYIKACAALQNNLFLLLHLLPTRFVLRSFLGSLKRFVRLHLRSREALYDFLSIIWHASAGAQPAGARAGRLLRERRRDYEPR